MPPKPTKPLIWEKAETALAGPGDVIAQNPISKPHYYSVYRGISGYFWYRNKIASSVSANECSSIEDGIKQAEADYEERYNNG